MKNTFIFTLSLMASFCISQPLNAKDGKEINTNRLVLSTAIESSAEKVWQVMIDFKNYPKWNPWYQIEGEAKVGAWIKA